MLMSRIFALILAVSFVFAVGTGHLAETSQAVFAGAGEAVSLLLRISGAMCFWSGMMEVMTASGLTEKVTSLLFPLVRRLFGKYSQDPQARELISQNMAANLLGLGSAATPLGLRAAKRLHEISLQRGEAPHAVFLLIVINTASLQLLPTTVAAVRAGFGSVRPFDILPAVWLSSAVSVAVAVAAARVFRGKRL